MIQFSQPILQFLLFLLLLVLQLILQSLYILFLLLCQYLQLRQPDCCFIIFRLIFIALILGTFIAPCCYGRIQLRFCLLPVSYTPLEKAEAKEKKAQEKREAVMAGGTGKKKKKKFGWIIALALVLSLIHIF